MPVIITLAGQVGVVRFHEACDVAKQVDGTFTILSDESRPHSPRLHLLMIYAQVSEVADANVDVEVLSYFEPDFERYRAKKAAEVGGQVAQQKEKILFFCNDTEFIGGLEDFLEFAATRLNISKERLSDSSIDAPERAAEALISAREDTKHTFCFLEFQIGDAPPERVVIELYDDICPIACENFKKLCQGAGPKQKGFRDSLIHRVVPGGWIQGGDLVDGAGDHSEAADGDFFPDESFAVRFDAAGIIGMANDGPHTNGSQFFITLAELPWMTFQAVAFGRVVDGLRALPKIEKVPLKNDRPIQPVVIADAGVL
eukprot:scaffold262_cov230-Pinguiococcus_pyrenoidosus.AAC.23